MADLMQNSGEEDAVDSTANSIGTSQEPFKSQTSSVKNNALRPPLQAPLDGPEKPLNGTQSAHSSSPSSEPQSSTLVNGPSSHSSPEEPGVSSGEASPQSVFGETRSKGRKRVPSFVAKTLPVQTETSTTSPGADDSDSEVPGRLSEDIQDGMPVSQIKSAEGLDGRRIWDFNMESSESSSDEYESIPDANWDPQKEFMQFLWSDRDEQDLEKTLETTSLPPEQRRRKRKMQMVEVSDRSESLYTFRSSPVQNGSDYEENPFPDANNKVPTFGRRVGAQTPVDPCDRYPSDTIETIKQLIVSAPAKKTQDGNSVCEADVGGKSKQLKTGPLMELSSEEEPSFFPCTKCNVNFKEKKHLHRHMMYHLDGNNQVRHVNVPRPFICRECGRSFRDRNSLLKHMIIHQERREKLIEEIKGLNELKDEGRNARLQCPQCIFGTNCPNTFVQHAKTHEKDKRYYCCEECDHMAVTEHELEAHLYTAHRITRKPQYVTMSKRDGSKERHKLIVAKGNGTPDVPSFSCQMCAFSTRNRNVLKKHVELIHQQPFLKDADSPPYDLTNDYAVPRYEQHKLAGKSQKVAAHRLQLKPKFSIEKQAFRKKSELPFWSEGLAHLFRKSKTTQKARKGFNSPLSKWTAGNSLNKLSLSLLRGDKQSKLSPQQVDRIDVTTGLPYVEDGYTDDDQGYGSLLSGNSEKPNSLSNCYKSPERTEKSNSIFYPGYESDKGQKDSEDLDCRQLQVEPPVMKKSPSKRKMSTPFHNTMDKVTHVMFPKHELTPKKQELLESMEDTGYEDPYDFSDYTSEATANFLDSSENEENPYARNYFIRRQRFSAKEDRGSSGDIFEQSGNSENDGDTIQKLIVKEECIETDVSVEAPGLDVAPQTDSFSDFDVPVFGAERKSCPYCPAVFESGVGLSNHVRGHLHRVGLSYDARHVVSPEQVASQDRRPRIRRKISAIRRMKKVHKPESQSEHTCPLCGGWFDTKTGLSNHVRGHLKRIGKTVSSTSKSPLCILNEMMQDEKEYQHILQVLNKKRFLSRPFVSQKFASSDGLFLSPTGIPVKIQHVGPDNKAWGPTLSSSRSESDDLEPRQEESMAVTKSLPSSTLIELLKKKKLDEEMEMGNRSQTARKCLGGSPPKERGGLSHSLGLETVWSPEKSELNKKVCVHCNTTFHSAVSLSNHLRAYARRKRAALLEGTTYDCKQKKQRSRPGPKKKIFVLPHTADEIYRLTCRFCDLVFQGPLSVQEDWIKHLQRHIMNSSVPHTGAGMVEVTFAPIDSPRQPEQLAPLLVSQVAS